MTVPGIISRTIHLGPKPEISNSRVIRTTGKREIAHSHYTELLARAKSAGLLHKRPSFYMNRLAVITTVSLILWASLIAVALFLHTYPLNLVAIPIMVLLGIMSAQYGFIAHETAHRQVFHSNRVNDNLGRVLANLFAGLSYGFWIRKHNRHHARPNQIGSDPDINIRVLSFTVASAENKKGVERVLTKYQGWLFPFLLLFTGFDLLLDSIIAVGRKDKKVEHRFAEFGMMLIRQVIPIVVTMLLFGPILGPILWLSMMMSFGLFMGGAFAPNHKGMPLVDHDSNVDFFTRQVLTSRNIRSTWLTDNLMGGLNFQVEHHLFPSMPRPNLKRAHKIVLEYCEEKGVPLTETGLFTSYGIVIRYLNKVGLSKNSNPFVCPMIAQLRPVY